MANNATELQDSAKIIQVVKDAVKEWGEIMLLVNIDSKKYRTFTNKIAQ